MSSSFGKIFTISTWGESHGAGIGATVDGCPAGISLSPEDLQIYLDKRRPGQNSMTTPRKEGDKVHALLTGHNSNGPVLSKKKADSKRLAKGRKSS
mgnify:FL=1